MNKKQLKYTPGKLADDEKKAALKKLRRAEISECAMSFLAVLTAFMALLLLISIMF